MKRLNVRALAQKFAADFFDAVEADGHRAMFNGISNQVGRCP
jgi:hypothetical protein